MPDAARVEADHVEASDHQVGVPLASWLAASERLTRTEAHRHAAADRVRRDAADTAFLSTLSGALSLQSVAVTATVDALPDDDLTLLTALR